MDISASSAANIASNGTINVNSSAQINTNPPAASGSTSAQASVHTQNQDDKLKFAYEKAIDAYQFHVKRFHTWTNYYALFTGAMFVGLYSINASEPNSLLQFIMSIVGLIASVCWLLSAKGHIAWEGSWIKIVKYYECKYFQDQNIYVYTAIATKDNSLTSQITNAEEINSSDFQEITDCKKSPKFFSTPKITVLFIWLTIVAWIVLLCYAIPKNCDVMSKIYDNICCIVVGAIVLALIIWIFKPCGIYSDVKGMYKLKKRCKDNK